MQYLPFEQGEASEGSFSFLPLDPRLLYSVPEPPELKNGFRVQMSLFLEPMFYVLLLGNAGFQWGFDAYLMTFVDLGLQTGSTEISAVNLLSYFAVADLFGNSDSSLHRPITEHILTARELMGRKNHSL